MQSATVSQADMQDLTLEQIRKEPRTTYAWHPIQPITYLSDADQGTPRAVIVHMSFVYM